VGSVTVFVYKTHWRRIHTGALPSRIKVRGILRVEGELLVLEYRESWRDPATLNRVEGPARRAEIPRSALTEIEIDRDWLRRPRLELRAANFEALRGWPGAKGETCAFGIKRDRGGASLEAAGELALSIADARLRALEPGP
jgi:hypothetical protein